MPNVRLAVADGRATVVLDRPPLNVLDVATTRELTGLLREAAQAPDLRVLVFDAVGRAFSAGVDVGEHRGEIARPMLEAFNELIAALLDFPLPTVARVKGAALGGGTELVSAMDVVLATPAATFGQPEIRLGVYPPPAMVLLPPLVGTRRARELILTGRILSAETARDYGIVTDVHPAEAFEEKSEAMIASLLALSGSSLRRAVEMLRSGDDYQKAMDPITEHYHERLMKTADADEGLCAFLEKRTPRWTHGR